MKYLTRWVTSWNQDCWEKYQQPQTCRWYHPDGREQRGKRNLMKMKEQSEKSGLNSAFKKLRSWHQFMANRWGKNETSNRLYFLGLLNLCGRWLMLVLWKKSYDKPRPCIKKQRHYFADKDPYNQICGFSSSQVWMWQLDHKKGWVLKNWYFWTMVLENTLKSLLDCRESKQSILREVILEYSLEGLVLKLKLQYLNYLMQSSDSLKKTLMLGKAGGERDDRR